MSVKVATEEGHTAELLCIVRALLKKIRQTVLVGDNVKVVGIDWPAQRGDDCSLLEVFFVLQLLPRARATHVTNAFGRFAQHALPLQSSLMQHTA